MNNNKVDRGIIEGRETPDDDIYILTTDGDVVWADNSEDAIKAEEELKTCHDND